MLGGAASGGGGGGRGRGRPPAQPENLRMPRMEEKPRSTLSAEAKEWFPPNYVAPSQDNFYPEQTNVGYYNDSQYNNYNSNTNSNSNYHSNTTYYPQEYEQNYPPQRYSAQDRLRAHRNNGDNDLQSSLTQLMEMLDDVTYSPGRFATLSGPLVDSFSSTLHDVQHTQPLVNAIVNQAIKEQNFRYNAARLCTMFDSVELQTTSVFRNCLLDRCVNEETTVIGVADTSIEYACGFAMFLAELYMQFENPEGGRIKALGVSLCKILKHMLITPNNNSTKAVCNILKLSGLALDADCKLYVDDIFSGLRASEAAGIQTLLVRNVINLRQNRWGSGGFAELVDSDSVSSEFQSMSINPPAPPPQTTRFTGPTSSNRQRNPYRNNNENNGGGMFYLPEGHSLTTEEAAFLNQHLPQSGEMPPAFNGDDHNSGDSDTDIWEPEMDAEQQADFLEFLRMSNQISR